MDELQQVEAEMRKLGYSRAMSVASCPCHCNRMPLTTDHRPLTSHARTEDLQRPGQSPAGQGDLQLPAPAAGRDHAGQVSRRRDLLQDRRGHPRPRRLPDPADLPAGERQPDGAADHDRQLQAGQRRADHRPSFPTSATPGRTARTKAACRSRPSWWPTSSRGPGPTAC